MSSSNRARNFHRHAAAADEDNQNDDSNATTTTTTTTARPTKPKPKKLLSFADDEDTAETPSSRSTTASRSKRTPNSRKGLGKRMDDGTSRVAVTASSVVPVVQSVQQQQQKFVYPAMPSVSGGPSIGGAIGVSQGLDAMISIPQQAEIAKKALQDNVRRLKESHGRTISSLTKTDENLTASYANITALGKSLSVANEKFIFMQKLVNCICDM